MANSSRDTLPKSDIPPHVFTKISEFLVGAHNHQIDLRKAHIRSAVRNIFPFIIFMYSLLIAVGVLANLAVLVHIIRNKLYKDPTYAFVVNNVLSDVFKCVLVLPLSLVVLLVQNWILGELLCSFLPMLQDIPLHVTTLTFVLIAWDRYKMIRNPMKPRMPAFVCIVGTWLTSFCLVLPYPIYTLYVDLGKYDAFFNGVGICVYNLIDDMQEYMRGMFLTMYAAPLAIISYLYVKSSRELQTNSAIIMFETRHRESRSRADSHSTTTDLREKISPDGLEASGGIAQSENWMDDSLLKERSNRGDYDGMSQYSRGSYRESRARHECPDNDLDVPKEKRTNKYLVTMVTMYGICLCPLMVLRLARLALEETYDNSGHFDITYTMFVWIAFLPTCSTPLLFAAWQMSRPAKERLRGYFRFSNRKLRQSCETVVTTAGTPAGPRGSHSRGGAACGSSRGTAMEQPLAHLELNSDTASYQQDLS